MPRDYDKNNGRPPRRERGASAGGKGRPGGRGREERPARPAAARGERKFGDKKFADRKTGDKRPFTPRGEGFRHEGPRNEGPRKEGPGARGQGRPRPRFDREDRPHRDSESRPVRSRDRDERTPRSDSRPVRGAGHFEDRRFGEKRPYAPRGEGFRKEGARGRDSDRPRFKRDDRGGDSFDRKPRRDFARGDDRGNDKPWEKREPREGARRSEKRFSEGREERGSRKFDRSPRERQREDHADRDRPRFERPRFDKPREERGAGRRSEWQEHPRSEGRGWRDRDKRLRRDNEDDSKIFAKRPAFGGRGEYRERKPDFERRAPRAAPEKKKTGERIAKIVARAGLCSRRDAEEWILEGRVAVNGRIINSPALDVTASDVVTIDGKPLPERERTRLFLYHKPRGLMTTHEDPEGRPTVFDNLPEGLPRLISVGRLDFNTEGLLLLTNDGGLSRALEHPDTGWLRRYRVRAHGEVTQAQLDQLKSGVEVEGVKYGPIDATLERDQGSNVWVTFAIREGKNREVRNVMAHLGLEVNRLIRISYGPFQLGEIEEGQVEEVRSRVLREQLGEKIVALSGAQFDKPSHEGKEESAVKKTKREVIADRKGRRVLVQRSGSDEARERNEYESSGYGSPRRPKRGYHGKRDLKPKDDFADE